MLNAGGASCIRHHWCSTKHHHDRGKCKRLSAMPIDGCSEDLKSSVSPTIQTRTLFFFLVISQVIFWKKKKNFLWGGKNAVYDDMILHTVRTTYFIRRTYVRAGLYASFIFLNFHLYVSSGGKFLFLIDPSLRVPTGIELALSIKLKW